MKKLSIRVVALTMVILMFAVPCLAASYDTVSYDDVKGSISVSLNGYGLGDESTIIVVKEGIDLATVADNEIVNIDQKTVNSDGTVSFELPVDERAQEIGVGKVQIYIGGTTMDNALLYNQTITLKQASVTTYRYVASFTTPTNEFASVDDAKSAVKVMRQTFVDDVYQDGQDLDVTSSCNITGNSGTFSISYAGVQVTTIDYVIIGTEVVYEVKFKDDVVKYKDDISAKEAVHVYKVTYKVNKSAVPETKEETGREEVTEQATINAAKGSVSVVIPGLVNETLAYTYIVTGIQGKVEWTEGEMALANAVVYAYKGEDLAGVTLTDSEGNYTIDAVAGDYKLIVVATFIDTEDYSVYQMAPVVKDVTITDDVVKENVSVNLPVYGDVNLDGKVDADDVVEVKANYTSEN